MSLRVRRLRHGLSLLALLSSVFAVFLPSTAHALPSYAQQTGQPCQRCHTVAFGPALTPYGMEFKLNAYTWGKQDSIPVSAMLVSSFTNTQKGQDGGAAPHFASNDNLAVDQTSLFYAGRIYGNAGAFVQVTYDGVGQRIAWDNLDLRYADHVKLGGQSVVYGVTFNNNPTVQDLWNSTPAWSFPYESSPLAPTPVAAPLLEGALAQQVGGLTAYTMIDKTLYLEGGAYRELPHRLQSQLGVGPNGESTVKGFAPYWRATLQHSFGAAYTSLGTFGMASRIRPGGDNSQGTDRYTDLGFDATMQWQFDATNAVNANATLIHENQHLGASVALGGAANATNHLNTERVNVGYVWSQTVSFSGGPFWISGKADPVLYAPDPIGGSASGSPSSRGYLLQLEYVPFGKFDSWLRPWANVRFGLQYTGYTSFNGGRRNYDGNGRNAGDNNTLYGFIWFAV